MSVDYHRLIWQELNKSFANSIDTIFVMRPGKQLSYYKYDVHSDHAEYNTYRLVDETIACSPTYTPKGSKLSTMWEYLFQGQGSLQDPKHKKDFERACEFLYEQYPARKSKFYVEYDTKQRELMEVKQKLKDEMIKNYPDDWKVYYNEKIVESEEYIQFEDIKERITPYLRAVKIWEYGLQTTIVDSFKKSMREILYSG